MTRAKMGALPAYKIWAPGLVAALAAASLLFAKPAHADTFTVTNTNDGGQGSLRQAITDANARSGADAIRFNIPGSGVKTISPTSALPVIRQAVAIDGYTQPGSRPNSLKTGGTDANILVQLNGFDAGSRPGLDIDASNVVVRGLAVNRFPASGVAISGEATGVRIEGNFIGTDPTGAFDRGNDEGVSIEQGGKNVIGGSTPAARNLISGHNIGPAIGIGGDGGNRVLGNLIGVQSDGTSPLFNTGTGGLIVRSSNNVIGGTKPGEANTIANNFDVGIGVFGDTTVGNRILSNSVFSNGDLGIDLAGSDVGREQDPRDPDTGTNRLQNFPDLTSAVFDGTTKVRGTLDSTPSTRKKKRTFLIQFFTSDSESEDGGQTFLGQKKVTTNRAGKASFTFEVDRTVGQVVTATATDAAGNTSEFSDPQGVSSI